MQPRGKPISSRCVMPPLRLHPQSAYRSAAPMFPDSRPAMIFRVALGDTFAYARFRAWYAEHLSHRILPLRVPVRQALQPQTPRSLGFNYDPTFEPAQGPPYFIVNGYASVGNPITGPSNSTQNDYEVYESLSLVRGSHSFKIGGEFRRTQINISQGIAANGFFVFAPFPTNNPFANFLHRRARRLLSGRRGFSPRSSELRYRADTYRTSGGSAAS